MSGIRFSLLFILLVLALSACTPEPTPIATPETPTPTRALPTATAALPTPTPVPQGRTLLVTSPADSGPGTLRQALLDAQNGVTITFDPAVFPPDAPVTIFIANELPWITQGNLTIDASNAGVILDGSQIAPPEPTRGLSISSNNNVVRGLQISGFSDAGIGLYAGAQNNLIGGDPSVGARRFGQANLISGNGSIGIGLWDENTSYNTIQGNIIGIDRDGSAAGHARDGIHSNGATYNLITSNIIGGNEGTGIYLCCAPDGGNVVTENLIGIRFGGVPLGNGLAGVILDRTSHNVVGPGNSIVHNLGDGISFWEDAPNNTVTQNSIHDNAGQGIRMFESQSALQPPLIVSFDLQAGTMAGVACSNCTVEIFSDSDDEGAIYMGRVLADSSGVFTFTKGVSFKAPHLTSTATDPDGNTSQFSFPTSGSYETLSLQQENNLPPTLLSPKPSPELLDNHIGIGVHFEDYEKYSNTGLVYTTGFKWVRIQSLTEFWESNRVDLKTFTLESIPPSVDSVISEYAANNVNVVLDLWMGAGLRPYGTTFQSEEEISRFSDYVRFIVSHFKGRIGYYEIWNEPGDITVPNYANLVRRVVPIIREEDPGARIIIGAVFGSWEGGYPGYGDYQRFHLAVDYLNELLLSGVAPLVDGISWHPFYDNIPSDPYYQDYPQILKGIKELAASQGFTGEYFADEILWRTEPESAPGWYGGPPVSPLVAAKLYTRAIALHRGLGVNITISTGFQHALAPIHNLNDTLTGAEPTDMTLSVAGEAANMRQYAFSLPNGEKLVAMWTNGEAVEDDPGASATLTFPNTSAEKVIGIDVLHGFEQELIIETMDGNLVIRDLLVKDYPIILRLTNE